MKRCWLAIIKNIRQYKYKGVIDAMEEEDNGCVSGWDEG